MRKPEDVIDKMFATLEELLKHPEVEASLAERGINSSLALTAADGLRAYLVAGDKARAAEELGTAAEEIAARMKLCAKEKLS